MTAGAMRPNVQLRALVRPQRSIAGHPLNEQELQRTKDSIERGDPRPYYGAIGGACEYSFGHTSLGCVVKVRNTVTGDTIDLTDYKGW